MVWQSLAQVDWAPTAPLWDAQKVAALSNPIPTRLLMCMFLSFMNSIRTEEMVWHWRLSRELSLRSVQQISHPRPNGRKLTMVGASVHSSAIMLKLDAWWRRLCLRWHSSAHKSTASTMLFWMCMLHSFQLFQETSSTLLHYNLQLNQQVCQNWLCGNCGD